MSSSAGRCRKWESIWLSHSRSRAVLLALLICCLCWATWLAKVAHLFSIAYIFKQKGGGEEGEEEEGDEEKEEGGGGGGANLRRERRRR